MEVTNFVGKSLLDPDLKCLLGSKVCDDCLLIETSAFNLVKKIIVFYMLTTPKVSDGNEGLLIFQCMLYNLVRKLIL